MKSSSNFYAVLLLGAGSLLAMPALAIHKCEVNGKISYSDAPCASGRSLEIRKPEDPNAAAQKKAQQDAIRAKAELKKIEENKKNQALRDEKESKMLAKDAAGQQKRCDELAKKKQAADTMPVNLSPSKMYQAQQKKRQTAEKYTNECINKKSPGVIK